MEQLAACAPQRPHPTAGTDAQSRRPVALRATGAGRSKQQLVGNQLDFRDRLCLVATTAAQLVLGKKECGTTLLRQRASR